MFILIHTCTVSYLRGRVLNITLDFIFENAFNYHDNHMLKWLYCGVGPFLSRSEFVFSHFKIDEIDRQKNY